MTGQFETLEFEVADRIATITLNRPHRLNAFNRPMAHEFEQIWDLVRDDPDVRAIVLKASEGRSFCSGVDTRDGGWLIEPSIFGKVDPADLLGPKSNNVWKPFIVAIHGLFAGGALYWLNESDIAICSDDAQFFDPHVTYGMVCALEPIGLIGRVPFGDIMRMTLMGNDERLSAETALRIGLVSEITSRETLDERAREIAQRIAEKPPTAIEGSLKAIWRALDKTRSAALVDALNYPLLGNAIGREELEAEPVPKLPWRLR